MKIKALIVSIKGTRLTKLEKILLAKEKPWGIILFKRNIKFLPKRAGERYASALTNLSFSNKVHKRFGKIQLKNYINSFIKSER